MKGDRKMPSKERTAKLNGNEVRLLNKGEEKSQVELVSGEKATIENSALNELGEKCDLCGNFKQDVVRTEDEMGVRMECQECLDEKRQVKEEEIEEILHRKLQTAYSEILEEHDIHSGDVSVEEQMKFDECEDELKQVVKNWISRRMDVKVQ